MPCTRTFKQLCGSAFWGLHQHLRGQTLPRPGPGPLAATPLLLPHPFPEKCLQGAPPQAKPSWSQAPCTVLAAPRPSPPDCSL